MRRASKTSPTLIPFVLALAVPSALLACKGDEEPSNGEPHAGAAGTDATIARGGSPGDGGASGAGASAERGGASSSGGARARGGSSGNEASGGATMSEGGAGGGKPANGGTSGAGAVVGSGAWPSASNTGVPAGTVLSEYKGSCTIDADGTVVDGKTVNCDLVIRAADVMIKNSKVNGLVYLDADQGSSKDWSFTLQDSEVDGGPVQRAAVSDGNMTILRSNIHGGETAVHCSENALSCRVQDSWLHGQYMPEGVDWHLGGFQSNGGTNIELIHNTVICDHPVNDVGGGCTGDINLIPDWATISHVTIENNFLDANTDASYCTYGGEKSTSSYPHGDHIVYVNNVFARGTNKKCGAYGPVTSFNVNGIGNVWMNNTWEDGSAVEPEN